MKRISFLVTTVFVTLAIQTIPARAQYYGGYGPLGGWGWYGGAGSTVQGDIDRGLGQFAIGAGLYNDLTARADAINADTLWRYNQYLNGSQQDANRAYWKRYLSRRDRIVQARERTDRRLRENPSPRDIARGDALNVALVELRDPRVSLSALQGGRTRLRSALIREIPFQDAKAGITISVSQLLREGPPPVLTRVAFAAERKALEQFTGVLWKELKERNELRPETVDQGLGLIQTTLVKVETSLPDGSAARRDAVDYLKGLAGLSRLLGTPAAAVLLSGAEVGRETSLCDLLNVMSHHGLRFGMARTASAAGVYDEIYPLLKSLCNEVRSSVAVATIPTGRVRP